MSDSASPYLSHPLPQKFRYLHEPLAGARMERWIVGRSEIARRLADRIMFSRGSAYLVTGFRGVGKTTFVHRALRWIEADEELYSKELESFRMVDVWINLARPMEPVQLMHHLIRHLVLSLKSRGVFEELEAPLKADLETAFLRTTFEISGRSAATEEIGRNSSFEAKWVGLEFLGKIAASYKRSTTAEEALKYLPYDERAAEFDIIALSQRLASPGPTLGKPWWVRLGSWLARPFGAAGSEAPRRPLKVIFVLDELDKLESGPAEEGQKAPLDHILETLKTVFTSTAFSFIFIAGKDFRESWKREIALGDSIYESVFADDVYLPPLWDAQEELLKRCLYDGEDEPSRPGQKLRLTLLYLQYKGRGIPRRLLRELNKHVVWENGSPSLLLNQEEGRAARVYAKLQEVAEGLLGSDPRATVLDQLSFDSKRLTLYYMLDWVVRRDRPFTAEDLHASSMELNLGARNEIRVGLRFVERTLEALSGRGFIEEAQPTVAVSDLKEAQKKVTFRLSDWVIDALVDAPKEEWPSPGESPGPGGATPESIGPYRVLKTIGSGGFGTVYEVRDPSGYHWALKLLHGNLSGDPAILKRFDREIRILSSLDHPNIVTVHDSGSFENRPFLVMDYVEGKTLREILNRLRRLDQADALGVAAKVAQALSYVHGMGIVRSDIKPSNVIVSREGQIQLIDFGIAKKQVEKDTAITRTGAVVGTLSYVSPEDIRGGAIDERSDIFSLSVVLYEILTGSRPFEAANVSEMLYNILHQVPIKPSALARVDPAVDDLVLQGLAKEPGGRFESMAAMAAVLEELLSGDASLQGLLELAESRGTGASGEGGSGTRILYDALPEGRSATRDQTVTAQSGVLAVRTDPETVVGTLPKESTRIEEVPESIKGSADPITVVSELPAVLRPEPAPPAPPPPVSLPPAPPPPPTATAKRPAEPRPALSSSGSADRELDRSERLAPAETSLSGVSETAAFAVVGDHGRPDVETREILADLTRLRSGVAEGENGARSSELFELLKDRRAVVRRSALEALGAQNADGAADLLFDFPEGVCLFAAGEGIQAAPMAKGRLTLGRSRQADFSVPSLYLSRHHLAFFIDAGQVEVEDLGSSNGASLRGRMISRAELRDGDELQLGEERIRIHLLAAVPAPSGAESPP